MRKNILIPTALIAAVIAAMQPSAGRAVLPANDNDTTAVSEDYVPESSIVDEVIWVVGDEAILKSDVENIRLQAESEGTRFRGDPDCSIPEQLAVQKLFLHQAALDSIEVTEAEISQGVEEQINYWISLAGSREKLEEYRKMSINQIRQDMHDDFKNSRLIQKMKQQLVEDIAVTPSDVRDYFRNLPDDSIPYVPTEVEVEIITRQPKISQEEINRVKDELRDYTERVTNGSSSFATLARLYSQDPGSARQGGELGYMGRGMLDPAFANVAFNLTDPKKISKIVESEFGYHIIQLIDKRGDKVNVRHILRTPNVSPEELEEATHMLDSLAGDIRDGKFSFEEAATYVSDDKDTKNNHGVMVNTTETARTSKFQMKDLPTEVAREVEKMEPGDISPAFTMVNDKGKTQVAIVKLKSRTDGHKATITGDFQVLKEIVLEKEREQFLHDWVVNKIKTTTVRMKDRYKNCDFEYEGWVQ
ncbi:MAG: peptidylprolyl isomerase [Prevotella sp.]|nr:peptidylprolyl isomerase [Prevotella sp.]MCD8289059.1 peptidylprolyl isomerase [Prevotella sp.]